MESTRVCRLFGSPPAAANWVRSASPAATPGGGPPSIEGLHAANRRTLMSTTGGVGGRRTQGGALWGGVGMGLGVNSSVWDWWCGKAMTSLGLRGVGAVGVGDTPGWARAVLRGRGWGWGTHRARAGPRGGAGSGVGHSPGQRYIEGCDWWWGGRRLTGQGLGWGDWVDWIGRGLGGGGGCGRRINSSVGGWSGAGGVGDSPAHSWAAGGGVGVEVLTGAGPAGWAWRT